MLAPAGSTTRVFASLPSILVALGCAVPPDDGAAAAEPPRSSPPGGATAPLFTEAAAQAGIDFVHRNGATGAYYYPELLHAGAAFLDYDGDGWLDVYLVQSGALPGAPAAGATSDRLFRNQRDGTFRDVTATANIGGPGYGTGVAVADYDRDGHLDVYVTKLGENVLYRNLGDGTFRDVTAQAGVADDGYSSAAAFVDYDGDGDLDLYVVHYLDWSPRIERSCYSRGGLRGYCSPLVYDRPESDTLFRNDGGGTFTDVSVASGIGAVAATGLGVVTADFDGDGRVDVYVANDQMPNHLWLNQGDGTFRDEALLRGCALDESGTAQASMGVVTEDVDDDGDWDLFSVNLTGEGATFHRNLGGGYFQDTTDEMRLGAVTQPYTGFGTSLFDFDNDSTLDLFIANGKVRLGDTLQETYAEPNLLLRGTSDGTFEDVSARAGAALALIEVSRAAAFGDYDNDGDVDILLANNGGPARLLRNEARVAPGDAGPRGAAGRASGGAAHFLSVALRRENRDRDSIGAVVVVRSGGRTRRRMVQPAYSYGASNDPRVHFGLGDDATVDELTVVWPDGSTRTLRDVPADQFLVIEDPPRGRSGPPTAIESSGTTASEPDPSAPASAATARAISPGTQPTAAHSPPQAVPRPPAADLDPQVAAAIESAASAVEADRDEAALWGKLGRVYESAEYYTLARACYEEALRLAPGTAEWSYHLGRLAADRGEPAEAARHLAQVTRLEPSALAPLLRLGEARLRAGDFAGAETAYQRVLALAPGAPWARVGMARLRRREGNVDEARRLLEEALAVEPRDREASYLLATIYAELGRADEARELQRRFETAAVRQWPPDPYLDRVMAEAVGVQVTLRRANRLLADGRLDEAKPLYDEILAARPEEFAALVNLANLELRLGQADRAIALFERALEQRPQDPHPHFGLALALFADGQRERGLAELEEVLRLDPGHQQARAMIERVR